ncbi:hypothetical protein EDD85DRAFT_938984 [Armillaria nabsnona]|nr:hypothetical protein EDD85DRAFT_938984 [Armillaria nabsnona]
MWAPGIALFLGSFQINLHSILTNRIMLLILKQRQTYRRYPIEELNDVENAPGITPTPDGRTVNGGNKLRSNGSRFNVPPRCKNIFTQFSAEDRHRRIHCQGRPLPVQFSHNGVHGSSSGFHYGSN